MSAVSDLHDELSVHMKQIENICRNYSYEVTPTLILRHKDGSDCSIIISNDDLTKVSKTIKDLFKPAVSDVSQTIREQLQDLLEWVNDQDKDHRNMNVWSCRVIIDCLETILATPEPETYRCNICGGLVQFDGTKPSIKFGPEGSNDR